MIYKDMAEVCRANGSRDVLKWPGKTGVVWDTGTLSGLSVHEDKPSGYRLINSIN